MPTIANDCFGFVSDLDFETLCVGCCKTKWAFEPPKPKTLTPAVRGLSSRSGQATVSVGICSEVKKPCLDEIG